MLRRETDGESDLRRKEKGEGNGERALPVAGREREHSQLLGGGKGSTSAKWGSRGGDALSPARGACLHCPLPLPQPESTADTDSEGRKHRFARGAQGWGVLNLTAVGRAISPSNCKGVCSVCMWEMVGRGRSCPHSPLKKGLCMEGLQSEAEDSTHTKGEWTELGLGKNRSQLDRSGCLPHCPHLSSSE